MNSYVIVRGFSPMIREVLMTKRMPPMQVDPHVQPFRERELHFERRLQTLVHWVDAGAPRGESAGRPAEQAVKPLEDDGSSVSPTTSSRYRRSTCRRPASSTISITRSSCRSTKTSGFAPCSSFRATRACCTTCSPTVAAPDYARRRAGCERGQRARLSRGLCARQRPTRRPSPKAPACSCEGPEARDADALHADGHGGHRQDAAWPVFLRRAAEVQVPDPSDLALGGGVLQIPPGRSEPPNEPSIRGSRKT